MTELSQRIISEIQKVPKGRVATYGQIARLAGSPGASRQVARLLHSSSRLHDLPWHRIVGQGGLIRLPPGAGLEEQTILLQAEGIETIISRDGSRVRVDMEYYGYDPADGSGDSAESF